MRGMLMMAAAAVGLLSAGGAGAQTAVGRWAVGPTVGTDGIGADLKYSVSPTLVLRGRAAWLNLHDSEDSDGIHYSGRIKNSTIGGFADWHPWANGWLLSAGVLGGDRKVNISGTSANNVTINGNVYTPSQIGSVNGRAKLPNVAGFLGAGYDSAFTSSGPLSFNVLAGVQLGGSPKVTLTSTGTLATSPQLQNDLRREEDNIRHDLNFTKYYPAISVGLAYRF